ncbi:hypothetical protein [Saccharibacillus qingshengii]|uniref:hypothetical protein n=1 Tax=Saccharibacillus qingshengii TaxID=1763540 RepID=UPI001552B4EC|nr:hypothetical protein [Saccharibacillus qingshengii]
MDRVEPFDTEKSGRPAVVPPQPVETEQTNGRRLGGSPVSVRSWESVKLEDGRISQPWHKRLTRIREGKDPRF